MLVESQPAERAVNAEPEQRIVLRFDEIIDEQQERTIREFVRINPDLPEFEARLDGDTVTLTPQGPMRDGVTYAVTVLPGLRDRDGNATVTPKTILFSVGGETPITLSVIRATIVMDTLPARGARYRLESVDDSFAYEWEADSTGIVSAEGVAYGGYVATAWIERVRPEGWQETEEPGARDTFALSITSRAHEETYRIAVVDTTAAVVERVETPASDQLLIGFDEPLADAPLLPEMVRIYESVPELWGLEAAVDTLPLTSMRSRQLAVIGVERVGQDGARLDLGEPVRVGRFYRVEVIGALNRSGLESSTEGGRGFEPRYEGAARFRSEAVPTPWIDEAARPEPPAEAP